MESRERVNRREELSGLFWLVVSILVCTESVRVKIGTFHNPGPGFLPFLAGMSLGVFSIILVVLNVLDKRRRAKIGDLCEGREWGKVVFTLIFLLLYTLLLTRLGYLIGTFGLMLFLFGTIGKTKLWIKAIAALFTTVTTYVIFYVWLGIQLPKGILVF